MEFIFGTRLYDGQQCEYVKTIGETYTEFPEGNFMEHVIETPSSIITHNFRIIRCFRKEQDKQGNHCTWYYIDNHIIDTDRTPAINNQLKEQSDAIDDILIALLQRGL